jgi:transcriptional regulator with XRE-family HTH domain
MASGVSGQVRNLGTRLALSNEEVAEIIGTSSRTVTRWLAGEATPQRMTKQRLLELVAVGELLGSVLKAEDANLWIFTPNRLLDFDSPAERIAQGRFRDVIALIEALADGVVT